MLRNFDSGDTHRVAENIKYAFALVEYALRSILQREVSGIPLSNEALGSTAVGCFYVSLPPMALFWLLFFFFFFDNRLTCRQC